MTSETRAAISIDFELFRHTPAYRAANGTLLDDTLGLEAAEFLLDTFEEADATVTFFVVSEIAEDHPEVVKRIAEAGHEIASHTHTHRLLTDMDTTDRMEELRRSRGVLEDVTGQSISGFRAPAFKMSDNYFADLESAGYNYDSSVVPCRAIPGWYGGQYDIRHVSPATDIDPDAPADIKEVPVTVAPHLRLPISGAWTRLLGRRYTMWGLQSVADSGLPAVLYAHPWEFLTLPDIDGVPFRVTWRTGEWMCETLDRILALPYDFVPVGDLVHGR